MTTSTTLPPIESLALLLRALKLPTVARHAAAIAERAERAEQEAWTFPHYLHHLVELEVQERRRRRIERRLSESQLPREKTTFGTVGPALIGVGAAAAVAGTVVAILGVRDRKPERSPMATRLTSWVVGSSAGIVCARAFLARRLGGPFLLGSTP